MSTPTWAKALWLGTGVGALHHFLLRPRMVTWGATKKEVTSELPGDEVSPPTFLRSTMAVTIDAPPERIWPWIVQMGWSRAGFYSYNKVEDLFGLDLHNANSIHAEWQDLKVGDTVWMGHPRLKDLFPQTRVARLEPNRALVLAILGPVGTEEPTGAWSFVLQPIDAESTRVLVRLQVYPPPLMGKAIFYFFMEPSHFIMQRGGLLGLKERVESGLERTPVVRSSARPA